MSEQANDPTNVEFDAFNYFVVVFIILIWLSYLLDLKSDSSGKLFRELTAASDGRRDRKQTRVARQVLKGPCLSKKSGRSRLQRPKKYVCFFKKKFFAFFQKLCHRIFFCKRRVKKLVHFGVGGVSVFLYVCGNPFTLRTHTKNDKINTHKQIQYKRIYKHDIL